MRRSYTDLRLYGQEVGAPAARSLSNLSVYNSHLVNQEARMVAIAGALSHASTRVAVDQPDAMPSDSLADDADLPLGPTPKVDAVANFVAMYGLHSLTEASTTSRGNTVLQGARDQQVQSEGLAAQAKESDAWKKIACFFGHVDGSRTEEVD